MKNSQKEIRKTIAQRLKTARENAGYASAQAFCEKHGFLLQYYQPQEEALLSMAASQIIRYCTALHISVCYLMLGEEAADLKNIATRKNKPPLPLQPKNHSK